MPLLHILKAGTKAEFLRFEVLRVRTVKLDTFNTV